MESQESNADDRPVLLGRAALDTYGAALITAGLGFVQARGVEVNAVVAVVTLAIVFLLLVDAIRVSKYTSRLSRRWKWLFYFLAAGLCVGAWFVTGRLAQGKIGDILITAQLPMDPRRSLPIVFEVDNGYREIRSVDLLCILGGVFDAKLNTGIFNTPVIRDYREAIDRGDKVIIRCMPNIDGFFSEITSARVDFEVSFASASGTGREFIKRRFVLVIESDRARWDPVETSSGTR